MKNCGSSLRPAIALWVAVAGGGCTGEEQATPPNVSPPAVAEPELVPAPGSNAGKSPALPRAVGEVALRMKRSEVLDRIGDLSCYESIQGFEVCRPVDRTRGERGLEVFLYRDEVISLAYEVRAPKEVWTYLEELNGRYGKPSLNGLTERDRNGRLHELYGWRDGSSLYSVRFIWQESANQARRLIGTSITLWDRQGYAAWERETEQRSVHHSALPADLT